MFNEFFLQRVQLPTLRQTLYSSDRATFGFGTQDQARTDQSIVERDTASTTVSSTASFLGARHVQAVSKHIQQTLVCRTHVLDGIPVHGC
jgi:hypothetical protein